MYNLHQISSIKQEIKSLSTVGVRTREWDYFVQ